ncbi:hypothetical protein OEZ86_011392 [Tetradesmus obliquus]|nr:hypothetical protein OEZ86_011392 [Tetradesmus obliquus]
MADSCSYIGKFECAVCQGVECHTDFCVLNCGHPFHVLCVETWLERSATCPSCRAKVTRRNIRPLAGVEAAPDMPGDEAFQQRLAHKQEQVEELEQQLSDKEAQVLQLSASVVDASQRQERLQAKLADARRKLSSLEAAQLVEQQRVSQLTADKQKLLERYKTDVTLLQHQLKDEQAKQRQVSAELRRLQLSNPRLDAASIAAIAGLDGQEQQQLQSAAALAGALALRNKQLQEAKASAEQLQQQVAQQQEDAARQLEAAAAQHEHEKVELQQDKQKHMRETLQLEYGNSILKQEKEQLEHQLQELRAALGPGILLPGLKQVPSFMARGKTAALGGAVTGDYLRSGPDGKGGTALHIKLSNKRVGQAAYGSAPAAGKKQRAAAAAAGGFVKVQGGSSKAGQTGIAAFLCRR